MQLPIKIEATALTDDSLYGHSIALEIRIQTVGQVYTKKTSVNHNVLESEFDQIWRLIGREFKAYILRKEGVIDHDP